MDECNIRDICGEGRCENVIGGFECLCREGYTSGANQACEG